MFLPAGADQLKAAGGLSVGILSATQGSYQTTQLLLDITQGARVASSAYPHARAPVLAVRQQGEGAIVTGWEAARRRARAAPQLLSPGLLAGTIPGGAGYAGITGTTDLDAVAAADGSGRIAAFSLGSATTLPSRLSALLASRRLVVADLPGGRAGRAELSRLSRNRAAGQLLIVLQRVPDRAGGELLWAAAGGLPGGGGRELTSTTTEQRGLLASVDLAPTILRWLGAPVPDEMRGTEIETDGTLDPAALSSLMARLRVISGRRLKALGVLLCAWALLLLAASPWPAARSTAVRAGAIGVLWAPVAVMLSAALEPGAAAEYAIIALACLSLGALTDLLLPWPRATIAPAVVAVVAISIDALAHGQLLMRSLLGPDPILGARFYGVGNELKSGLAVIVLAALAGALYPSRRGWPAVAAFAAGGLVLAAIEGAARIGAGVGGVILVCAGFAVAGVMMAPGALTRRRALIVLISPLVGLVLLALIDLATAHGSGHFTGSVLHARSPGDVRDILVRRYKAAWDELRNHAMPVATALALACAALALRRRERLLAPVSGDPAWLAALVGGLTAGVVGALVEDSGPELLVVANVPG
ncbi:MAG: hypothetical protein ACLQBB_15700, partial [Solirubrobacteraceae bacterium]